MCTLRAQPGSHKSELRHPAQLAAGGTTTQAGVPAAELIATPVGHRGGGLREIPLKAGDAVLFNDSVLHGSVRDLLRHGSVRCRVLSAEAHRTPAGHFLCFRSSKALRDVLS